LKCRNEYIGEMQNIEEKYAQAQDRIVELQDYLEAAKKQITILEHENEKLKWRALNAELLNNMRNANI
jgi:predicted  nucleic acid-binding Zn-ribbon protein